MARNSNLYVVFISTPMSGLDMATIRENLEKAGHEYLNRFGDSGKHRLFVSNIYCQNPPPDCEVDGAWYLGNAIQIMSRCDEVFFYGNWQEARGCLIEHEVCEKYGIRYTEVQ